MYDLAIIGGGPGGYVAAERAGAAGLSVVLFEKRELGGVCLNEGCIPTKTLLYSAKVYNYAKNGGDYGVSTENASFDYGKIVARKDKVVKKLVGGVKAAMKAGKVTVVKSAAMIEGRSAEGITVGTNVTVVEMLPKILGPLDDEISATLQKIYEKRGIKFCLRCKVTGIEGNAVVYEDPDGKVCKASGDKILVSVGRRANLTGYGLENLGVEYLLNRGGKPCGIKVDEKMRTNIPGVYAAGDVTGFSMLAHTASREGEVAVNDILGKEDRMRYDAIPGVVYTNPEVAGVGLTEEQAKASGKEFEVIKLPMAYAGRFVAENEHGEGICKLIVGKKYHEVLGAHMLGNPCSEIIHSMCIAIEQEMTVEQLKEVVFPHPTVSEIIKETSFTIK